ncbi:MAG: hypothetical protein CLLPBCKN_007084 [Chroococcidiopsis cubana SAG 39.79]|uniref:Uncharacterized protein n=1 Tax=Chroococcidiopsis cubana SAG 39.79 TaxID=388085 RepID=A0AB37UCS8_9CYAN|nr:hypothetical protein [Chroococcidiopsis cubana]MDZ4877649.1 hypothetical protein [Chroococcidiopsis cubana SAG 39.79]RUT04548.1 hypothetical protein DSM107010_57280 [Chroococcidiopsis cubana SAG 39.79]
MQPIHRDFGAIVADPSIIPEAVERAVRVLSGDRRPDLFLVFAVKHEV